MKTSTAPKTKPTRLRSHGSRAVKKPQDEEVITLPGRTLVQQDKGQFLRALAGIYQGKQSADSQLFHPLQAMDPHTEREIGVVTSRVTMELFRLSNEFAEKAGALPRAKNRSEVEPRKQRQERLQALSTLAATLFSQHLLADMPQRHETGTQVGIREGWKIVVKREFPAEDATETEHDNGKAPQLFEIEHGHDFVIVRRNAAKDVTANGNPLN